MLCLSKLERKPNTTCPSLYWRFYIVPLIRGLGKHSFWEEENTCAKLKLILQRGTNVLWTDWVKWKNKLTILDFFHCKLAEMKCIISATHLLLGLRVTVLKSNMKMVLERFPICKQESLPNSNDAICKIAISPFPRFLILKWSEAEKFPSTTMFKTRFFTKS